ncbi:MAG: ECF-type sigma factor [Gemmataceae bacterium]
MTPDNQFQQLMGRVRARDEEAAAELLRRYESVVRRVIRINLRDARMRRLLDSMDVCQSVMATFFARTALGEYEVESPEQLLNLLASIARHKLINQAARLKARRRDIRRDDSLGDDHDRALDPASDPSEQVSAKEMLEKIQARLDPDERYLAEQRALGRGWRELAGELGGTDVALRKKFTRALDRVMCELGLDDTKS